MDPVTVKFAQWIIAQLFGMGLAFTGVWLFIRGASGHMSLFVKGGGLTARLTNATPGAVVFLGGCTIVLVAAIVPQVERETAGPEIDQKRILEKWLERSTEITEHTTHDSVEGLILGDDTVRVEHFLLDERKSLGDLAAQHYEGSEFWKLLAAINNRREYISLSEVSAATVIPSGSLLEVWHPSIYHGKTRRERITISSVNKVAAYDEILEMIEAGYRWNIDVSLSDLQGRFLREKEMELAYTLTPEDRTDANTLRELSFKYYRSGEYWPIIAWTNSEVFDSDVSGSTPMPEESLLVIYFLP